LMAQRKSGGTFDSASTLSFTVCVWQVALLFLVEREARLATGLPFVVMERGGCCKCRWKLKWGSPQVGLADHRGAVGQLKTLGRVVYIHK